MTRAGSCHKTCEGGGSSFGNSNPKSPVDPLEFKKEDDNVKKSESTDGEKKKIK